MSSRSPGPSSIAVVAILASGDAALDTTLEAVVSQNYEPAAIYVVGKEAAVVAKALDVSWAATVQDMVAKLGPSVTHVWLLREGAVPRMDALYALIFESERVGAGVAGSKLLELVNPERLVSVGIATDVFDVPYRGLDDDELDAGQYDVVRDVAAVAGVSVLVRRDLLKGIGGPDRTLAPEAAAIDLSQRARLVGARVVVVPSSEVAVTTPRRVPRWQEEAGRIRAMIKVYGILTLVWALPVRFLVGFVEAVLAPFVGRWTLLAWLRSWAAALFRLPATLAARRTARKNAAVGDVELFRYQVRGSAALKGLWGELVETARSRFPTEDRGGVASLAQEMRRPSFGIGLAAAFFAFIATRQLWSGFPGGGFSLPLPAHGADAVAAYAGGWNPAGFGSVEQLPPFLGIAGVWQQILFDRGDLAAGALTLIAFVAGIWGTTRLLRTWSIDSVAGIFSGVVLMAGPAARTIAGTGDVANLIALGAVPWVIRVAVAPWPDGWVRRIGRILTAGWMTGLLANLSPDLLLLPLAAVAIGALLQPRQASAWRSVAISGVGVGVAFFLLRPWINSVDFDAYFRSGTAFWEPGVAMVIALAVVLAAAIVAAPEGLVRIALWGGIATALGTALARTASTGGGRHVEALGLAAVSLGTAFVVGAVFDSVRRAAATDSLRRLAVGIGAVGAAVIVASTLLVVAPGRGGLPADELTQALRFTGAAGDESLAARVLLIGPPESLPGTSRRVRGAAYRVIAVPLPRLWDVELVTPGPADAALQAVIEDVIDGDSFRAGSRLAGFGIRWILAMGDTPLTAAFVGQLDLIPLDGLRRPAFRVDSESALRAVSSDGVPWRLSGTGFVGEPAAEVTIREQASPGWGTDLEESEWWMTLDGSSGHVEYEPGPGRRQGELSLWLGVALMLLSGIARRRE